MTYGRGAYGQEPYGGSTVLSPRPGGGLSIPGYDPSYSWVIAGGDEAYGRVAYGGRSDVGVPSAGLSAAPDPGAGTVTIPLWWSFAEFASLTRVDIETGERTPVRSSPVKLPAGSRRNPQTNPKARDSLTGLTAGSNTSLSRLTGLVIPGFEAVTTSPRMTATAAGSVTMTLTLDPATLATTTYGFLARSSALLSDLLLSVTWYDATGASLGTTTASASSKARTQAVGAFSLATITVDDVPGNAATGVVSVVGSGLPAGGTLDITARISALGATVGPYFDGDYAAAAWTGTPGLSYSDIAPIVFVTDAEAPFDTAVRYELTSSAAPGYVATTTPITLPSTGLRGVRQVLLTHPGLAATFPVWIESEPPSLERDIDQGVFKIDGRRLPVVVSADQRSGDTGVLTFVAPTLEERRRLLRFFDDGSPVLLRMPARFGHPPLWWLSIGKVTIRTKHNAAHRELRRLDVEFTEVERPSAATRPMVA